MDSNRLYFDAICHGNMFLSGIGDPVLRGSRSMLNMEEILKRRPFFSSSDELIDEEFYDEQLQEKKRRLTPDQVQFLEKSFEVENKLEPERKTQLAKKLGLQSRQVAVWFQNRRARWKTKQLERDYDLLKASYDDLLSNYNTIIKEHEKLKSEVVSLTEKLQAKEVIGQKSGQLNLTHDADDVVDVHLSLKVEDHLSSGSGGSAVLDEDGPQLVDSGDSYFPADDYHDYMGHVDGLQSEEDEGSVDGRSYFINVLTAAENQQHNEGTQPLGWWVWS